MNLLQILRKLIVLRITFKIETFNFLDLLRYSLKRVNYLFKTFWHKIFLLKIIFEDVREVREKERKTCLRHNLI